MECCCHVWAYAPGSFLNKLDELQKRIFITVGPSHAVSLEPFADRRNVASLSLFYKHYFDKCSSEPAELHAFLISSAFFQLSLSVAELSDEMSFKRCLGIA